MRIQENKPRTDHCTQRNHNNACLLLISLNIDSSIALQPFSVYIFIFCYSLSVSVYNRGVHWTILIINKEIYLIKETRV